MQIYPAIDIKGGRVVRMRDSAEPRETVYAADPVAQAETLLAQGATWLHVVDVDRAYGTGGDNSPAIAAIARLRGARVQVGGNLSTAVDACRAVDLGAARVVAGTKAVLAEPPLDALLRAVGSARLAVAVEVKGGVVWLRGTGAMPQAAPLDLVRRAAGAGATAVVYRDLDRDGLLEGADVAGAARLVGQGIDVIVAGGIAGVEELGRARDAGLAGVILGRALHEGRLTVAQALTCSR